MEDEELFQYLGMIRKQDFEGADKFMARFGDTCVSGDIDVVANGDENIIFNLVSTDDAIPMPDNMVWFECNIVGEEE